MTDIFSSQHQSERAETMLSAYRHRRVIIQAFPPGLDPLHWSKVGTGPVKPFVVTVAPLAIMDQNLFFFVVNFLDVGSIPARLRSVCMILELPMHRISSSASDNSIFRPGPLPLLSCPTSWYFLTLDTAPLDNDWRWVDAYDAAIWKRDIKGSSLPDGIF